MFRYGFFFVIAICICGWHSKLHSQWFLEVVLSPCRDFYVFNAGLPEGSKITSIPHWFSVVLWNFWQYFELQIMRFSASSHIYVEDHYSEIVPEFAHSFLQIGEALPMFTLTLPVGDTLWYPIMLLTCCQLT